MTSYGYVPDTNDEESHRDDSSKGPDAHAGGERRGGGDGPRRAEAEEGTVPEHELVQGPVLGAPDHHGPAPLPLEVVLPRPPLDEEGQVLAALDQHPTYFFGRQKGMRTKRK